MGGKLRIFLSAEGHPGCIDLAGFLVKAGRSERTTGGRGGRGPRLDTEEDQIGGRRIPATTGFFPKLDKTETWWKQFRGD